MRRVSAHPAKSAFAAAVAALFCACLILFVLSREMDLTGVVLAGLGLAVSAHLIRMVVLEALKTAGKRKG